ncbi:DUF5926 family protein [Timonella senegalensis]|uniref:DUF5926 family protein n=4 Tax=Timonella senegalensis TaxID=1465825 RepID=UPI0002EA5F52|nr:DUF5926 family protein [Timonella senegalensis]
MAKNTSVEFVLRPFEGLPAEADLVAMREIVPAATIKARTNAEYGSREFIFTTSLPNQLAGLHRTDGVVLLALQTLAGSGDLSRDLAANLLETIELEPGTPLLRSDLPEAGPRLQDILDLSQPFEVEVRDGFDYWMSPDEELTPEIKEELEDLADSLIDTVKLDTVDSAYWCRMGAKEFLRWSMPYDEDAVINGIARLHAKRESSIDGSKFLGAFRSCGIVIPVWELVRGTEAEDISAPAAEFWKSLKAAIENTEPLDSNERRARAGIISRQITLR